MKYSFINNTKTEMLNDIRKRPKRSMLSNTRPKFSSLNEIYKYKNIGNDRIKKLNNTGRK